MKEQILLNMKIAGRFLANSVNDIEEAKRAMQPAGLINHPAWSLAHVCVSLQNGATMFGHEPILPEDWIDRFGNGSTPVAQRDANPTLAESLVLANRLFNELAEAYESADTLSLNAPTPREKLRGLTPTLGQAVVFLTTTHVAYHAGQISSWKRAMAAAK